MFRHVRFRREDTHPPIRSRGSEQAFGLSLHEGRQKEDGDVYPQRVYHGTWDRASSSRQWPVRGAPARSRRSKHISDPRGSVNCRACSVFFQRGPSAVLPPVGRLGCSLHQAAPGLTAGSQRCVHCSVQVCLESAAIQHQLRQWHETRRSPATTTVVHEAHCRVAVVFEKAARIEVRDS